MIVTNTRDVVFTLLQAHLFGLIAMVRESWISLIESLYSVIAIALFIYLLIFEFSAASNGGWAMDLATVYVKALVWPIYLLLG